MNPPDATDYILYSVSCAHTTFMIQISIVQEWQLKFNAHLSACNILWIGPMTVL